MKDLSFHLIKSDSDVAKTIEIATYQIETNQFVVCKNSKRIGLAALEPNALQIHDMYTRIHLLHEDNSDPNEDAKIEEMISKPQNNGFLHDSPAGRRVNRKKETATVESQFLVLIKRPGNSWHVRYIRMISLIILYP